MSQCKFWRILAVFGIFYTINPQARSSYTKNFPTMSPNIAKIILGKEETP